MCIRDRNNMSTSVFEKEFVLTDPVSIRNFLKLELDDSPAAPISQTSYTAQERDRSEKLLSQFLSHSKH